MHTEPSPYWPWPSKLRYVHTEPVLDESAPVSPAHDEQQPRSQGVSVYAMGFWYNVARKFDLLQETALINTVNG